MFAPTEQLMHNYSGMGLGGGTGAGVDPFITNKQLVFMGDGTFFHSGQLAIANSITQDSSADATGTASYARIYNSGKTTCYFQGTVGTSTCDFIINNVSIQSGGVVSCSSLKLRLPRE